ncbi:histidine kinase dimerization/phosphoacceptor domain -containing protein [Roseateles albus]|uniref:histidine kinase n=1 Tax=Roseateles albus TaxID=2987525 RepID=A0ABT5KMH1_9BURK|nr:histidine kinase dimerization/phosphoacceptor domain -containing protein [Roseateles albus]MDC8774120.1 histidine kinase dimerization/phosphoacceptor domain -containing protein [Roseateles albus]
MSAWLARLGIRQQIYALVLLVCLPLAAMLTWQMASELAHVRNEADERVKEMAHGQAANLSRYFAQQEAFLARLAEMPGIRSMDPAGCELLMRDLVVLDPRLSSLVLRDLQARPICSTLPTLAPATEMSHSVDFVQALQYEGFTVGGVEPGLVSGHWVSLLSYPVRNQQGEKIGLLRMVVDLQKLSANLLVGLPSTALTTVVDQREGIAMRSVGADKYIGQAAPGAGTEAARRQRDGFVSVQGMDGVVRRMAYQTLPGSNWRVVAGLPEAEVLIEFHAALQRTIVAGLAVLVLALLLAWRLGLRVAGPIDHLADTARRVADGDQEARADLSGSADVRQVAAQFNLMLDAFKRETQVRERAFADLQQSEARFRALIELSSDWYWEQDENFRFTTMTGLNGAALNSSRQSRLGKTRWDLPWVDMEEQVWHEHRALLERHERFDEFQMSRIEANGQLAVYLSSGLPRFDAEGKFLGYHGVARDVTAARSAAALLSATVDRYQQVLANVYYGILLVNNDGTVDYANQTFCDMFGLNRLAAELIGMDNELMMKTANLSLANPAAGLARVAELLSQGIAVHDEEVACTHQRTLLRDFVPLMINGEPRGRLWVFRDITQRQKTALALQLNESRLRMAEELAGIGSWVWPVARGEPVWSDQMFNIYGRKRADGVPASGAWKESVHPDDHERLALAIQSARSSAQQFSIEYRIHSLDGGELRHISSKVVSVADAQGQVLHVWGVDQDVTAQKLAQQVLQTSLNEKVALLNEVHHRVKNNLQVITSLLRLEARRSAEPGVKTVLEEMQARIRSMSLLHESLYRSGIFAAVDLAKYLRQLTGEAFRAQAPDGGMLRLVLDLSPLRMNMDQAMPCGLLVNELISNCLKHGFPPGSQGEVLVSLQPLADTDYWRLQVSDTGLGLPADFEVRRKTSLGLQLASDLARQLGGELEIGPGPGASLGVSFKVQQVAQEK